jgi:hypothetical protein
MRVQSESLLIINIAIQLSLLLTVPKLSAVVGMLITWELAYLSSVHKQ